jgi:hypothetical protein
MIILEKEKISLEGQQGKEIETRSSNNSASPLNLFTNPFNPNDPDLPNVTRGLNFDDNTVSRNAMRGYTIGIPVVTLSTPRTEGDKGRNITELYDEMLDTWW